MGDDYEPIKAFGQEIRFYFYINHRRNEVYSFFIASLLSKKYYRSTRMYYYEEYFIEIIICDEIFVFSSDDYLHSFHLKSDLHSENYEKLT